MRWWVDESIRLGRRVGADADVVLTSCAPYETAWAGAQLAAALGKPWVADLEDPWALDEMRVYPTAAHRALDLRQMRRALATASAIVMAAPEAALRVQREIPELADRVVGMPIGFERDDFEAPAVVRDDGVFRIVHTGSLHTDLGLHLRRTRWRRRVLGGTFPDVNVLTRSHIFLIEAIAALLAAEPALKGRIELHLAGVLTDGDRAIAAHHSFVRMPGLLSHHETVALMRSASCCFFRCRISGRHTRGADPLQDLRVSGRATPNPGRGAGWRRARHTHAAPPRVRGATGRRRRHGFRPAAQIACGPVASVRDGIDSPALRQFDRRACVTRVAAVLDDVLASSPRMATRR